MDTHIEFLVCGGRSDTSKVLREYALRRLSYAVRRFSHRVCHLRVRLVDENGPRRGVDSRCSITAGLVDGGSLYRGGHSSSFAAITLAAGRLSEALRRDAGRHTARPEGSSGTTGAVLAIG